MRRILRGFTLVCFSLGPVVSQTQGVPARSKPTDYPASVTVNGTTYAASVLTPKELKHLFAFDISRHYTVLEVAVYPPKGGASDLGPERFVLSPSRSGDPARPSDAETVASIIQQKNIPSDHPLKPPVSVGVAQTVGHESGTDPYTGRRVNGTYSSTEVGVGVGDPYGAPPPMPGPGGYPEDREVLERQLTQKGLPKGEVRGPVAGYIYFPSSLLKRKGADAFQLQYLSSADQPTLAGASSASAVQLRVPARTN